MQAEVRAGRLKPSRDIPGIPQVQEDLLQVGHGIEFHVAHPGDDERLEHVLRSVYVSG